MFAIGSFHLWTSEGKSNHTNWWVAARRLLGISDSYEILDGSSWSLNSVNNLDNRPSRLTLPLASCSHFSHSAQVSFCTNELQKGNCLIICLSSLLLKERYAVSTANWKVGDSIIRYAMACYRWSLTLCLVPGSAVDWCYDHRLTARRYWVWIQWLAEDICMECESGLSGYSGFLPQRHAVDPKLAVGVNVNDCFHIFDWSVVYPAVFSSRLIKTLKWKMDGS